MSAASNKGLIKEYLEAIRKDKLPATLDKYIAEEALKQHVAQTEAVTPGYWIEAEELIAEDDKVTLRGTIHAMHTGPLMGVPPTGKPLAFTIFITYRIANHKIVEHWMLVDSLALMQQIGALPAPSHA
ncbi:MAG: ester cyclase [Chloroflexi bacterium]|uniref:ester cyclase n=1 Tax=Candidatus Flexifilum breve TaxID=3140694 RepID=UPI0031353C26|nr:ester cyclase [Chloroflexota bacterium]